MTTFVTTMDALNDIVLLFWGFYLYLFFLSLFRIQCPSFTNWCCLRQKKKDTPVALKEVFILRGVPGSGKDNYVYFHEAGYENSLEKQNNFAIVSNDEYFTTFNNSTFSGRDVMKSMSYCLNQYLNYLQFGVSRIYVSNINNKGWMYSNFVKLANIYNYKVTILELDCLNENFLKYFRDRTKFQTPLNFCKNVYSDWDRDQDALLVEPYLGNHSGPLPGDSLPYPKTTESALDKELEEYMLERCTIQNNIQEQILVSSSSDSDEYDSEFDSSCEDTDESNSSTESESESESESSETFYSGISISRMPLKQIRQLRRRQVRICNIQCPQYDTMMYSLHLDKKKLLVKDKVLPKNYFKL